MMSGRPLVLSELSVKISSMGMAKLSIDPHGRISQEMTTRGKEFSRLPLSCSLPSQEDCWAEAKTQTVLGYGWGTEGRGAGLEGWSTLRVHMGALKGVVGPWEA